MTDDTCIHTILDSADGKEALLELFAAARAFTHFSFDDHRTPEEEEADRLGHARAHSSVPFVRVEQRLRRAVRACEDLIVPDDQPGAD